MWLYYVFPLGLPLLNNSLVKGSFGMLVSYFFEMDWCCCQLPIILFFKRLFCLERNFGYFYIFFRRLGKLDETRYNGLSVF